MSQRGPTRSDIPAPFLQSRAVSDRLVHLIPDQLALQVPQHVLFAYATSETVTDGFVEVTAKKFANAINRASWYLESVLGKAPLDTFPTVAYIGTNDLRYLLFMFGAIKAGYKMLFLSPRNTIAGHVNVLEKAVCDVFLFARHTQVSHITAARTMISQMVPELAFFLEDAPVSPYPYDKTFAQARDDPCLVLHTTGSTGLPKPITWKLEILSTYEAWRTIPSIHEYVPTTEVYQEARRVYNAMPLFHTSGLNISITMSLVLGVTTVFGAANVVPHAAYAIELQKYAYIDASASAPSVYEDLALDDTSLESIRQLRYVLVCGAPLAQSAGELLSKHTRVISNFGATETACLPRLAPAIEDWAYFYWHPTHSGIELRESIDGLYELFLVKRKELRNYQGIFSTFPYLEEYSMNDLYSRHPDPAKPFLYRWCGRADDVIVLSNGEKLAPALMEAGLRGSPLVQGAMVVGRGKFQPAALIDLGRTPPTSMRDRDKLRAELMLAIEGANAHAPAHGKLDPFHILFVDPSRPMKYLGQGKIQRHQTYMLYQQDIENVYEAAEIESMRASYENPPIDFGDRITLAAWLANVIARIAPELSMLGDEDIFFEKSMDSLQVLRLVRELKTQATRNGLDQMEQALAPRTVYANPSIERLSRYLNNKARQSHNTATVGDLPSAQQCCTEEASNDRNEEYMRSLLDKYTQALPVCRPAEWQSPISTRGMTVLLTGSTGSLGSYLLDRLNNDVSVDRIICLDRSSNAAERYEQNRLSRGLSAASLPRVEFHQANVSLPRLGLDHQTHDSICATITHIIHCQWPVNFNWPLSVFEPYIAGVKNLVDVAHSAIHRPLLLFVSSVASVGSWNPSPVPEEPILEMSASAATGYGQSKLIAECLLDRAARLSGVRTAVCRIGIVAGPVEREEGMWNAHEYIPSVIISSAYLGILPDSFPSRDHIDWLPVDTLSSILVEIISSNLNAAQISSNGKQSNESKLEGTSIWNDLSSGATIFNVVNPQSLSWSDDFASALMTSFPQGTVTPVPFEIWLARLKASAEADTVNVDRNPAIRLIDFYEDCLAGKGSSVRVLSSVAAQAASKTLRELGAVRKAWLQQWLKQWDICGTISQDAESELKLSHAV